LAAVFADGSGAHANNVTQLVGASAKRLQVGDFRVIFEEADATIVVTKIGPRGGVITERGAL
jgi:mRNA interferase RelE/StbE